MTDDIAVVGLACLYPGAPDLGAYWRNILAKVSAITDPPAEAWSQALYYDPTSEENDRVYCRKGGYLGPLAIFDPLEHGIMPRSVEGGEPDQWLALHVARAAMRDAGYPDGFPDRERAALILGKGNYANRGTAGVIYHGLIIDHTLRLLRSLHPELTDDDLRLVRQDLKRQLPRFDAETAPALIPNVSVGRIANRLDLMGPSYTIDAACASSLVAIDTAVKGLRSREYDTALVGGMQVATPVPVLGLFCQLKALSIAEDIRPFDEAADGTILSEGVGMAVLKRREDAERDGDRIYAFVKGSGVASDGKAVSVLAPRVEGEALAVRRAYESAGVAPQSVGLVEAHGTATLVGDAVEIDALQRVFGGRQGNPRCAIGSVKSMIGHTMPAAGMAGFIKAALALHHKVLPPTINVSRPSPRLQLERTPFYINTESRPWVHGASAHPRRAGVNAFGFGGINAHVVLEEAPASAVADVTELPWDSEVCVFAGETRAEVVALCRQVLARVAAQPDTPLVNIAAALNAQAQRRPPSSGVRLGVVAASTADLAKKLERAISRLDDPACTRIRDVGGLYFFAEPLGRAGKLAFLFPGEGAQYVNMLADLCVHFPEVRACFDEMDRVFADHPRGYVLSDRVFPPPTFSPEEQAETEAHLWKMDVAVEAIYTANHAMHTLLTLLGVQPDVMLGHSTGELSAMHAADMFDQDDYERRLHELNRVYGGASVVEKRSAKARLIAVGASREKVDTICAAIDDEAWVAMDNCRHQVVIVARGDVGDRVETLLKAEGLLYEVLSFDRPYHTAAFGEYAEELRLRQYLNELIARPPRVPLYSATSTAVFPEDLGAVRELAFDHWIKPVEFRSVVEKMYAEGVRLFVEVGPRGNLTAFIDDILAKKPYAAIPANVSRRSGLSQLHHLLAQLAAHGVAADFTPLYRRRRVTPVDFDEAIQPSRPARTLGPMKIPTGAPDMHLSPDTVARLQSRFAATAGRHVAPPASSAPATAPDRRADAPEGPVSSAAGRPAGPMELPSGLPPQAPAAADTLSAPAPHAPSLTGVSSPAVANPDLSVAAPLSAAPASGRTTQVMTSFMGTMGRFLSIEQQVVGLPPAAAVPAVADEAVLPFLETVLAHEPGQSLIARSTIDLARVPGLRDHSLGRALSTMHPELPAFAIVPFTMWMEVMAEAALALSPDLVVIGMRDVRVHRWTGLDRGAVSVEIQAQRTAEGAVAVRLFEVGPSQGLPFAEGTMLLAAEYATPPVAQPPALADAVAGQWTPDTLYESAMFHGPAFRGVLSVDRVAPSGAEGAVEVLDPAPLLSGGRAAGLVTDLVLLDQPGQLVGFWAAQMLDHAFMVLPSRLQALELYGGCLRPGERLRCTARVDAVSEQDMQSTLEIVRADGRVWARFIGWEDRRFDLPTAPHRFLLDPRATTLSQPWAVPVEGGSGVTGYRIGLDAFPKGWLIAHGDLWSRVLATAILSERERAHWNALTLPPARRQEWLFGRLAAKDAVRHVVRERYGLSLCPADVEIVPDTLGRPTVQGAWLSQVPQPPSVSLSHVSGTAVAIAGAADGLPGVGIDLERMGRMSPSAWQVAFNDAERRLLDTMGADRDAWALRLWCAKEAAGKAMGIGLSAGWLAFVVSDVDRRSGAVHVHFKAPGYPERRMLAATAREGDWIVATCAATAEEKVTS